MKPEKPEPWSRTCMCVDCRQDREHDALVRALKVELRTQFGEPEYDWPALEAADRRSREDPEWYKRKPQVKA